VADKEIVFHQDAEMEAPLGVCVLDERTAVVSCSPYVWLLEDTDGDGKADRKTVLLKTAGGFQGDHAVHSFVFGPDGKLYFNFGNFCSALQWPDGSPVVDLAGNEVKTSGKPYRQGLVFRCDLDRAARKVANVETLGWNFRNNYEVAVDSFGTLWQSDNDDDGNRGVRINYVMEFGNFGYVGELDGSGWSKPRTNMEKEIPLRHWHLNDPGVVPNLLQTGSGSPTGICVNEGSLLGPAFENQVIHADAGPRVVRAYPAAKDGAGFSATMVDILTGPDSWYRPADVVIAPDGSLFIADWYDPGVGGHGMADNIPGRIRGRIYRVAPTAYAAAYKVTPPDLSTAAGAVEAIKSPCGSTRAAAFAKLRELGAAAEPELLKLWKSENPRLRARAIQLLARIDGQAAKYIEAAAADADANLRVVAVRMARALSAGVLPLVAKLADDADPAVRRECAIALRGRKETEVPALWARLAAKHDGKDRWYLEALGIGAAGNDEACFAAWLSGAGAGENWNTPAGRDIVWRVRAGGAVEYLVKLLTDPRADPRDLPRYLREFDFLPDSDAKNQALLKVATAGAMHPVTAIDALQRLGKTPLKDNPEVKTALGKLLDANKGKPGFIEVAQAFGVKDRPADMLASALSDPRDPRSLSAVAGLVADPSAKTMLASTLAKGAESAPAAAELLGLSGNKEAAAMLRGVVSGDTPADPAARTAAVRSLASSAVGAAVLVSLAEENKLPADLKAVAGLALAMVNYPGISEKATKLLPGPDLAGGAKLPPIAELVKRPGDAERGRAVFLRKESSCIGCHRVGELGADVGPGLTEIGSKYDKAALYESILNPSAAIAFGYETTKILTADGTVVVGIVRSETKSEIVMVLPGGAVQKVDPKEVDKRVKEKVSLMPEGLGKLFSPQDLADLVEYLSSLKAKKP
jgi:putative membrane-bound dehydrogenase-like protein